MRGAVLAVITTVITLFVGLLVTVSFINQATPDTTWTTEANDTWDNVQTYTWVAYGLIAVGILVLGAAAVLVIINMMSARQ